MTSTTTAATPTFVSQHPTHQNNALAAAEAISTMTVTLPTSSSYASNYNYNSGFKPLFFTRENFTESEFSPESFIAQRRHVPLDRLKKDLSAQQKTLKNELVELINQDYTDFINLSTNMLGLDHLILELNQPLQSLNGQVKTVRDSFSGVIHQLETKLEQRANIREKKASLFYDLFEMIKVTNTCFISTHTHRQFSNCISTFKSRFKKLKIC